MTDKVTLDVTDDSFTEAVERAKGLVLVDFWAAWCGPCRIVAPVLEQVAREQQGRVTIAKMDVEENQRTAMRFNVRAIPSILFFKDGRHVDTIVGAVPKPAIEKKIEQHLS